MAKQNKIRWGILGAGNIARKFASDLQLVEDAELVAIGSRSIENANLFAKDFPVAYTHKSYEELAQNEEVDVIYIATPHSHHYENVLLCLKNNKAVLCEKAFAVNTMEAKKMIRMAREKKLFLMEAVWTKFLPQYSKIKEIISSGMLGDIRSVIIDFGFIPSNPAPVRLFDPALAGGTILDIGIYNVLIAMSVLGKPDQIETYMTPASTGVDEQCSVLFRYKNGAMAQLFSSFVTFLPTEAHINGTKGRIKLGHRFYTPEATIEYYSDKPGSKKIIDIQKDAKGHGYQYEARHVCECLRKELTESPVVTLDETIERMEVLDEIRLKAGVRYAADQITL